MRWSGFYIALSLVHLATCSPVPVVLKERLEVFSDAVNGVVTVLQSRSSKLSTQTPIEVGLPQLQPLTKHRPAELWGDEMDAPVVILGDEDLLEATETDVDITTFSSFARPGMPCRHGRILRENNDMLIIYLATSFLLVVVMVETWGSYMRRERGTIRLEKSSAQEVCCIQADTTRDVAQAVSDEKKPLL